MEHLQNAPAWPAILDLSHIPLGCVETSAQYSQVIAM